jgi:hypothetical protein
VAGYCLTVKLELKIVTFSKITTFFLLVVAFELITIVVFGSLYSTAKSKIFDNET